MSLIKCKECGKEISDQSEQCIHCGYKNKPQKEPKKTKNFNKKTMYIILGTVVVISIIIGTVLLKPFTDSDNSNESTKKSNETICNNLTNTLEPFINSKDTKGFEDAWFNREGFDMQNATCSEIKCVCPKAWDLFVKNKINQADNFLENGLVSSAYDAIHSYISTDQSVKEYHDQHNLFKLISSKEKEEVTGIYYSFGEWSWQYKVGGSFKFNKRYVSYGSSSMTLKFDNYSDQILISGHLKPSKHKNWNADKNIAVEWYNYKILNNKIYIKLKTEDDSKYDSIFEIKKITDTSLSLKLLMDLDDVKKGQVYNYTYKRS